MVKEGTQPNVEVFKRPSKLEILGEFDNKVRGVYPGVKIGVTLDGQEVWSKSVHTHHVGMGGSTSKDRLYGLKVSLANRKANRLAKNLAK